MTIASELSTIRDFLRYAISAFRKAKLVHGHGTTSVVDEAAFIILETLGLPVDDINPWLDAKLLNAERATLAKVITARIKTRKPAAYLVNKIYMHGIPFFVDERVIVPRSYLGELLMNGLLGPEGAVLYDDADTVGSVLDLCTGSGCLAILAALSFPEARITGTDLSKDALQVAKINCKDHDVEERLTLLHGNLFQPVKNQKFDLILTNPPYVAKAEVKAFPKEYAHEPVMAHLGGADGLDLVRKIIVEGPQHLNAGGALVCEMGTGRDIIEAEFPKVDFLWLDTATSEGEVFVIRA